MCLTKQYYNNTFQVTKHGKTINKWKRIINTQIGTFSDNFIFII